MNPANPSNQRPGRPYLRRIGVALCVLVIGAYFFFQFLPAVQPVRKWRMPQAWKNMHEIILALHHHYAEHGSFPYDPRGSEYALYSLAQRLPASRFDADPPRDPRPEAYWDQQNRRIVGSDFEYLNPPHSIAPVAELVILVEKNPQYSSIRYGLANGHSASWDCPGASGSDLLGSWRTWDQFFIADEPLFRQWEALHFPTGTSWTTRYSERTLEYAEGAGIRADYTYDGDHLRQRTWHLPDGTITETVETDRLGRITAFTRTPENWQSIWPWPVEQ